MGNMSYCRFENTFKDLDECLENWEEKLSESEEEYKLKLIKLCKDIACDFGNCEEIED